MWRHYLTTRPGQVQVIAGDLFNGSPTQLATFRDNSGGTYPFLLTCGSGNPGNENFYSVYADRHNWVVINKVGVVRYNADDAWDYGNRYHLNELYGCIDTLVSHGLDVPAGPGARGWALTVAPTPFGSSTGVELNNPTGAAVFGFVTVHDLAGRRVTTLWNGPIAAGITRRTWDARAENGARVAAGVYLIRSEIGGVRLARRVVVLR